MRSGRTDGERALVFVALTSLVAIAGCVYAMFGPQPCIDTGTYSFGNIAALASNTANQLYIADPQNNQVVTWNSAGSQPATTWFGGYGNSYAPTGLAVDSSGNLYIADSGVNRIFKMSPAGSLTANRA